MTREIPNEEAAIAEVVERLSERFPDAPVSQIDAAVQGAYSHFEGAKVRDFIPVLTEREARANLEQQL